jgi:hypothetical protein
MGIRIGFLECPDHQLHAIFLGLKRLSGHELDIKEANIRKSKRWFKARRKI